MSVRSLFRGVTPKGYATPTSAPIYVDSDDNRLKVIPAGSGSTEIVLQEANGAARAESLVTTKVLTAAESGKTFYLGDVDGFAVTLPAPALGLNYKFIVSVAPTEADYTIGTNAAAAIIQGMVNSVPEDDAGLAAVDEKLITFVVDVALKGDWVQLESNGTDWFVSGQINVIEALTFTAA